MTYKRYNNEKCGERHLLHVFGDGVLSYELGALLSIELFGVVEEEPLEELLVDGERRLLSGGIVLVQPQLNYNNRSKQYISVLSQRQHSNSSTIKDLNAYSNIILYYISAQNIHITTLNYNSFNLLYHSSLHGTMYVTST